MSKIGRIVQDIMERFNGEIPEDYTLENYFKDIENEKKLLQSQRKKISSTTSKMDVIGINGQNIQ
jgi:hypothetical protein